MKMGSELRHRNLEDRLRPAPALRLAVDPPAAPPRDACPVEQERERTRVWLHDTALQALEYIAAGGYGKDTSAADLRRAAARAADDLRAFVDGERSPSPDGLVDGLRTLAAAAQDVGCPAVRVVAGPDDGSVEPGQAAVLVAAAREALTNVRKHARASAAVVYCEVAEGGALVSVRDDGVGFDARTMRRGTGLQESIEGRLVRAGGEALIESAPGAGTHVTLRLPAMPGSTTLRLAV
jgi:signal transduction histidine kinase